jgi:lysophospholipid acyltransferase (LPLAT)-like uncharacterized protein
MKIRHPLLIKALGFVIAWLVRVWIGTVRYRYRALGANVDPTQPTLQGRYLYAFWHENILLPAYHYGRPDIGVLISEHADGEMIAQACRHLGFQLVRGSRTRGGSKALRAMLNLSRSIHLAITPDGPRGPRRHVQPGVVYLAARTGMPIVPIGVGFQRAWRMKSWDRFALPYPCSAAVLVTGEPLCVPADVDKDDLEHYRLQVEQAMTRATEAAENILTEQTGAGPGRKNVEPRSDAA